MRLLSLSFDFRSSILIIVQLFIFVGFLSCESGKNVKKKIEKEDLISI